MALLIRKLSSSLSLMVGLVLILSWFYWADYSYFLLFSGLALLLIGIVGVVTTIAKAEEEFE